MQMFAGRSPLSEALRVYHEASLAFGKPTRHHVGLLMIAAPFMAKIALKTHLIVLHPFVLAFDHRA